MTRKRHLLVLAAVTAALLGPGAQGQDLLRRQYDSSSNYYDR